MNTFNRTCLLFSCFFSFLSTSTFAQNSLRDNEQALYAISSLRCHLQQLNNASDLDIPFSEEDVDQLWIDAENAEFSELLDEAKCYYDQSTYEQAAVHLDSLWNHALAYQNFDKNPYIDKSMKKLIAPYLIPEKHPSKPILDAIFSHSRVTSSLDTLKEAGFNILYVKDSSYVIVAKHPLLDKYLFKLYTDNEVRTRLNKPSWKWLVDRCEGAERIRKLIKKKKIKNFVVPDKLIYPLPPIAANGVQHPIVLMVTDMQLVSRDETKIAWRTVVTKKHLDELYIVLSHGFGSNFLSSNVPYSKTGKFAFVDTEYPYRKIGLTKVKLYIDPSLHAYWDELVKKGGKK
jgi:hypothetical protein